MVALQQLPVQAGLVVVALEEGQAGQLDQVAVAGVALGQQGEVVVELAAALGVATGVVHPAPAGRALRAVVVGHVGLGAEHRRDPLGLAGPVEVEDPVHVAVVGDADGRLAVGRGRRDQVLDPRRAVEHRVLGVDVEVGERVPHEGGSLAVEVVPVELWSVCWSSVVTAPTRRGHQRVTPVCFARVPPGCWDPPPPLRGRCPGAPGRGPASAAGPGTCPGMSWPRICSSCWRAASCWANSVAWMPWKRPSSQPTSWAWATRSSASVGTVPGSKGGASERSSAWRSGDRASASVSTDVR